MKHKCGLSMRDYEGVFVELEIAQEALQNALLILDRRRIRKDKLSTMIPIQNDLATSLWKLFMMDSGRNDGPRRGKSHSRRVGASNRGGHEWIHGRPGFETARKRGEPSATCSQRDAGGTPDRGSCGDPANGTGDTGEPGE